jgi:hypothetical protein
VSNGDVIVTSVAGNPARDALVVVQVAALLGAIKARPIEFFPDIGHVFLALFL